jgi:diguanylate cyclase (GGDEF)-like protein
MKRRNGSGSRRLLEVTEKFTRSQVRFLATLVETELMTAAEAERLRRAVEQAASQKRSSDVLDTAMQVTTKAGGALRRGTLPAAHGGRSDVEVLFEISRAIQRASGVPEIYSTLLERLRSAVPFENATLYVMDRRRRRLEPTAVIGAHVELIGNVDFDLGSGFTSWVAKRRRPILLRDLHGGRRDDGLEICCFLAAPIVVQGHLTGLLALSHSKPRAFDEDDLRLVSLIGGLAGGALERIQSERSIRDLLIRDPATGTFTENHFHERLRDELERFLRYDQPFSLVTLQIDNWDALVSACGAEWGEEALADVGRLLSRWSRSSDLLGRTGPVSFAALLPFTVREGATTAAERLREILTSHRFPRRKKLAVSVGLAVCPVDGADERTLLDAAERDRAVARGTREALGAAALPTAA